MCFNRDYFTRRKTIKFQKRTALRGIYNKMLSSFLNSVIKLFKGPNDAADSEDDSQATVCEKRNSCNALGSDEISPGLLRNNGMITNNTDLSGDVGIVCSAMDNAEISSKDFQSDTNHASTMNIDVNIAPITKNRGYISRVPMSYEYRSRALTVDESLLESLHPVGKDTIQSVRTHRDPTFFAERLEKCVSLPNLFRTTSIQDKSMKITRKRRERKHARLNQTKSKNSSSESENETNERERYAEAGNSRQELELETKINSTNNDSCDGRIRMKAGLSKSFDSLMDELKDGVSWSDSDEYFSCNEELLDDNDNTYPKKYKTKKLNRISSIQKRSWSIRQRRRENFYKRRSMDVPT